VTKSVKDIMTTRLQTIGISETAKDAAKKMVDKNVSSLIVIDDDNQTVGIITERDITRGVCIHDVASKDFKIHHLMSSPLATIDPNSSAETAANRMLQNKVRHLIVKDGDRPVGIITASNFIDYLDEQLTRDDPNARVLRTLKDEV
jgi:signal-transduction protein with cAMP-binding, CBS, and nucleotidyltransferase domain